MNLPTTYDEAIKALNELYSSRTGESYAGSSHDDSEQGRVALLKQRIYEEKIWPVFLGVLRVQTVKKKGRCDPEDAGSLKSVEIASAIVKTAEICLSSPEAEVLRRVIPDLEDGSAYYDVNTNEKLRYGLEDLFQVISHMQRRFVWDVTPRLKPKVDEERKKILENHPNVLGDTQLIQNALYFNAEILTKDEGAKQMARNCGLKPVNEFLVSV